MSANSIKYRFTKPILKINNRHPSVNAEKFNINRVIACGLNQLPAVKMKNPDKFGRDYNIS